MKLAKKSKKLSKSQKLPKLQKSAKLRKKLLKSRNLSEINTKKPNQAF